MQVLPTPAKPRAIIDTSKPSRCRSRNRRALLGRLRLTGLLESRLVEVCPARGSHSRDGNEADAAGDREDPALPIPDRDFSML